MARELAIPCFLARVAAGVALLAIGSVAAESLAVAAEAGTATEATGGTATEATGGTGATDSGALQEIIVTARKRAEDLQRTPVSITAFSQQDLENHSVRSLDSLAEQTPSLSFQQSPYDTFGSYIGIRGQQSTDIVITQTPPVGIYIDDVYYSNTLATQLENFEGVEQIEVLKGPQGTLYGRNTTGGAIKITTQMPDYDGIHGDAKVGYGNYNQQSATASINLPIVDNRIAMVLTGHYASDDGYGRDITNGADLEDNRSEAFRGALRFDVTDQFQVMVRGEWAHAVSTQNIEDLVYVAPGFTIGSAAVAAQIGALTPTDYGILGALLTTGKPPAGATPAQVAAFFNDVNKGRTALASYICPSRDCRNVAYPSLAQFAEFGLAGSVPVGPKTTLDLATASIAGTYNITPDLYLKSISAFQETKRVGIASTSASPFLLIDGISDAQDPKQFTEELQVGGSVLDNKLAWVTGYYYYHLHGPDEGINTELVPLLPNPVSNLSEFTDTSNSGYAQGTYALTPTLHATAGIRYTSEQTELTLMNHNSVECQVSGVPPTGALCSNTFDNSFSNVSYTGGLDWQALDRVLLYAKTSRGFRAGGTNQRSDPALDFAPEIVTDYEIGAKTDWFDRRLRANLALYHSNYKDIQRSVYVDESASFVTEIQNAASAKINGVELEITARPIAALTLNASGAYTMPHYDTYVGFSASGAQVNLAGNAFPNVSRWQGSLSGTYTLDDRLGPIATTVDFSYRSTVDYQPDNHDANSAPYTIEGGYGLLNARITQTITAWRAKVSLWGKNIADRHYIAGANDFSTQLGYAYVIPGLPATYGVELEKDF
jgi:iron complex outermembrane receptor protein